MLSPNPVLCPSVIGLLVLVLFIQSPRGLTNEHHVAIFFRLFVEDHEETRRDAACGLLVLTYPLQERMHLSVGSAHELCSDLLRNLACSVEIFLQVRMHEHIWMYCIGDGVWRADQLICNGGCVYEIRPVLLRVLEETISMTRNRTHTSGVIS
jgi:hypothetical protein